MLYMSERLKEMREKHGLTQDQAAMAMNVSRRTISGYENAEYRIHSDVIIHYAATFHEPVILLDSILGHPLFIELFGEIEQSDTLSGKACKAIGALPDANIESLIRLADIASDNIIDSSEEHAWNTTLKRYIYPAAASCLGIIYADLEHKGGKPR